MIDFKSKYLYYSTSTGNKYADSTKSQVIDSNENGKSDNHRDKSNEFTSGIILLYYGILIGICTLVSKPDSHIFLSWNQIEHLV
jgi:hypothetical protein